jgi:site-specific recombinase XerD
MDVPRCNFAHVPTPIEALPRLSETLGGPRLLVKRDDQTGLALGKGKKDRVTFLGSKAHKALWKYLRQRPGVTDSEPLWLSERSGQRLTQDGLRLLLVRLDSDSNVFSC